MSTRPKVHRAELARALAMIAKRRAEIDDPDRELLPDAPDSDPREVLDYLRKYSGPSIPRWVLQAEVCDALTLNNWLWWEDRRRELYFLKAGRDRGLFLTQLGAQVGVGKQGILDRIDRLEALLRFDRPDEKIMRAARQSDRESLARRPAENAWLACHRDELLAVITGLVGQADRYRLDDADREWVDQLAIDAHDDDLRPTTMVILGLAVAELRTAPPILAVDTTRPCAVHALLTRADRLRSQFAGLGARTS
jgi:hypothetical protein